MSSPDEEQQATRTFHPVHERSRDAWFPGDEDTSLLITIQHTWEDIERLGRLRSQIRDYDRKLLLKYVIIEIRSLIQAMDRLHSKVMSAKIYEFGLQPVYRGISSTERAAAREHWSKYSNAKKAVEHDLIAVRNRLGAHRDVSDWQLVMALWDKLGIKLISTLLDAIPPAFNHAKDLDIFEWTREPEPGVIEIIGGPVGAWLFDEEMSSSQEAPRVYSVSCSPPHSAALDEGVK